MDNPFDPLTDDELRASEADREQASAEEWTAIVPIPKHAFPMIREINLAGYPLDQHWAFRNAEGQPLAIECKWVFKDKKEVRPAIFCRHEDGREEWRLRHLPAPRPLYGLDQLAQRPDAPVMVVEGAKKCEPAEQRFLEYVAVASSGGTGGVVHADWAPLEGRRVVVWPDADEPGRKAAAKIAHLALEAGAASVRVVQVPRDFPDGWDLADGPPAGVDLHALLAAARPAGHEEAERRSAGASGGGASGALPGVSLDDFNAYMPTHAYVYMPTREMWPAVSVDARIPPLPLADGEAKTTKASRWLDQNKPIEQMTWAPGEPDIIEGRLVTNGGWIERPGCRCLNLYRPPTIVLGDPAKAQPWLDHVHSVYPDDADHIIMWLAHRVQRPHEKINHALVFGGSQGIGKDTILEPLKAAIGPWNFEEVNPKQVLGRFNGFLKSVILRVSELRDLGEIDRYAFYDAMKAYTAAPPDVLRVDEKHLREYSVFNVTGVILTTNHKADGIFLPADDRRHFVAWSTLSKDAFSADYWTKLHGWYASGGNAHVAAYLHQLGLSAFDAKAPPPKTAAWWDIVSSSRAPEDAELADALDGLGNPNVITLAEISREASALGEFLSDRKNSRKIPHRFEECGYTPLRNGGAQDGLWKINGRRQAIYAKSSMALRDQLIAAKARYGV